MLNKVQASIPGKVFLSGEHAVVYGAPAVLGAINLRCQCQRQWLAGSQKKIVIEDKRLEITEVWRRQQVINFANQAEKKWQRFNKTGDIKELRKIMRGQMSLVKTVVGESLKRMTDLPKGEVRLMINSEIPIGSGLGSSAALATAIATVILGKEEDKYIDQVVTATEKRQHGQPSGADQTVVKYGGFISYRKLENSKKEIKRIKTNIKLPRFLLINSGRPKETTGEMVAKTAIDYKKQKPRFERLFKSISDISNQWVNIFKKENIETDEVKGLISENEQLLEGLSVVGDRAKEIIRQICLNGGAAKICGAGGIKKGSGMLLATHQDIGKLKQISKKNHWQFFEINLGERG